MVGKAEVYLIRLKRPLWGENPINQQVRVITPTT